MLITIGDETRKAMTLLGIKDYPFSSKELRANYKQLLKQHHPDLNGNSAKATKKTQKVTSAYNKIKNLTIDIGMDNLSKAKERFQKSEKDMFDLWDDCKLCHGEGVLLTRVTNFSTCPNCQGEGNVILVCRDCHGTGKFKQARSGQVVTCRKCKGSGVFRKVRCNMCNGEGKVRNGLKQVQQPCHHCGGLGKVKVDPFNPVIRKAAVMV